MWQSGAHMMEHTIAFQSTPEHAMALQGELQHMFQSELWHASHSKANARACHGPLEHTVAHVPEQTIAFWSTPEHAIALQGGLQPHNSVNQSPETGTPEVYIHPESGTNQCQPMALKVGWPQLMGLPKGGIGQPTLDGELPRSGVSQPSLSMREPPGSGSGRPSLSMRELPRRGVGRHHHFMGELPRSGVSQPSLSMRELPGSGSG
ncbi:hypothetical protein F5J12DRAFT_782903 [Pisolithus orientalis]|uniref:uncharacterized protein n=1 Tax=Pisolithus orientalis TaxID=936130 RepID=UPI0022240CF8|nr:uncharacterized protein F5J12DRAFT_782903 [Pisolithus orientalis]KAI6006657.1 hypothetical protein F5J12DRAFT_782903 [Pisolithus orientalis]